MDSPKKPGTLFELIASLRAQGVPQAEWKGRMEGFLEAKARRTMTPIHGTFELTPLCNFDCKMCYVHLSGDRYDSGRLLGIGTWKSLMSQAHEAGMFKATLTGGECLTYPGFDELYVYLNEIGVRVSILTNGALIRDRHIELFQNYRPNSVQITLYGADDATYEAVTGRRAFQIVYDNIIHLRDAGIHVALTITPNRFMTDDPKRILELCESLGIEYHINAGLLTPRRETGRSKADADDAMYLELYTLSQKLKNVTLIPPDPTELPDTGGPQTDLRRGLRCGGGSSGFFIRHDGKMAPCSGLYDLSAEPLELGFLTAWREVNRMSREYLMPIECDGCAYRRGCLLCPAMHRGAPEGHCDESICRRTRLFVGTGLFSPPRKDDKS